MREIRPKYYEPTIRALIKISVKTGSTNDYWMHRLLMMHKKASVKGFVRPRLTGQNVTSISNMIKDTDLSFLSNNERQAIQKIRLLARRVERGGETRGAYFNKKWRQKQYWANRRPTLGDALEDEGLGGARKHLDYNIHAFREAGFTKEEARKAGFDENEIKQAYDRWWDR